jgi:hypothetical protein
MDFLWREKIDAIPEQILNIVQAYSSPDVTG